MITTSHLSTLLAARKVVLWVEDTLTKEYLLHLWQPEDIHFNILVGGGNRAIRAVVHDLREDGYGHVFGLTDLDFGQTNKAQWLNPASGLEVFRLPVLEIENYLLDWDALEGCQANQSRHRRTKPWLEQQALGLANTMTWWMACRSALALYQDRLQNGFPEHPKIHAIQSLAAAQNHIETANGWHGQLLATANHITDTSKLSNDLILAHSTWSASLSHGTWVRDFSGREIYRVLRGYVLDQGGTTTEMDIDLAKSIGDWQHDNNRIPQDMRDLLAGLKSKAGIP